MTIATPYLFYPGTCREAFTAYATIFGTAPAEIMSADQMPPTADAPPMPADSVMHAVINLGGGSMIYGSDDPSEDGPDAMAGCNVHIAFPTYEQAEGVFHKLAEGGEVRMPFKKEFWTPGFGALSDRWGIRWMVSVEDQPGGAA